MVSEVARVRSKEEVEDDIERLREWLQKQPHLPHEAEHWLLSVFVQGTKTLEIAKRKLDAYYSMKNKALKVFELNYRDPCRENFKSCSRAAHQYFLPNTTPEGYRVMVYETTEDFPELYEHAQDNAKLLMLLELGMKRWPESPGYYWLLDVKHLGANFLAKLSPSIFTSVLTCFQEGYPVKLAGVILINAHPIIEFILNSMIKPFLKEKLFKRITATSQDITYIKNMIPMEILPSTYGGKEKSSSELNDYWTKQLEENREWFKRSVDQMSDESKRPPDSLSTFGIEGTFRKLAVD